MSNPEDNTTKSNGLGTDSMQRLASFKAPRDLTLGGVKPNKKVFTPNLNVTRNKNRRVNTANNHDQKKDKAKKERINDRNKNLRNGPNIIKSSGVFSEGLGSVERQSSGRYSYGRDSDPAPILRKPTIRVKDVIKIDKELEEQKIKAAVGDGSLIDEVEDFRRALDIDAPIKLPMDDGAMEVDRKPLMAVKKELFEDTDVVKVLRSEKPTLFLLQLPDTLPGRGGSVDDEPRRKQEPSTSTGEEEEEQVDNRCRLKDLEEGRIGKLRIHQSGRVTLALGDTIFEVCTGTKGAFHQEVVSMSVDNNSRSANLVSLGGLEHKLNLVPDWETMFSDMSM